MATKKTNYITKDGYQKLLAELQDYRDVKLPEVLERLSEAKALGDLSENFEYKSAMEDKDFINSKVLEIEKMLANVEIMEEESIKTKEKGVVDYGSVVTLKIDGDKDEYKVKIVGIGEASINGDDDLSISLDSPVGNAIRGRKAGDKDIKMRIGNDRKSITILKVE